MTMYGLHPVGHSRGVAYALGGAIAAVCAMLQWLVHPLVANHIPFLFFLVGLMFAAVSLGRGPATLVLCAGIVNAALLAPPVGSLAINHPHDLAAVLLFGAVGTLLVVYGNRLHLTTHRAALTEQRFSVALESSVVPFSILSPVRNDGGDIVDFKWSYLNPAAARAVGRDIKDLLGNAVGDVLPAAWDAPDLFDRYVRVVEHGEQCEFELRSSASNRGLRWYSVVAAPLQGSVVVWFANITESKEHQQRLEDADRRKDEFLATLAHELRNPLAPIRQAARIAGAEHSTDAQRRWSHSIVERQVQHMSLLLEDLLDVSRVGRGTLLLRKSPEALVAVVDTAIETARPHIEAKRHHLDVELPPAPVVLHIDALRMSQVLGNLLTNAAKYTEPGGRIRLRATREADEFIIRVADNGIGLTPAQQAEVFEMFRQVPAAVEKSQGGLGIGLALARGLVELHGGTIEARSAGLGHGTEFIVRLPAGCVGHLDTPAQPAAPAMPARATMPRILIADDNVDAADSLAELLRLDGYEVHVAYDGAKAIETFARVEPDAALLDVGMPEISGLEVVRELRRRPAGQRATLIAVTGWGQEHDRRIALEAGFDYHMTKPMMPEHVQHLLARGRPVTAAIARTTVPSRRTL